MSNFVGSIIDLMGNAISLVDSTARSAISTLQSRVDALEASVSQGLDMDAIKAAVREETQIYIAEHPEVVTTIEDGSIVRSMLTNSLRLSTENFYVTPEQYGAAGNGTTDDTQAIRDMIADMSAGQTAILAANYKITGTITINKDINFIVTGMISVSAGFDGVICEGYVNGNRILRNRYLILNIQRAQSFSDNCTALILRNVIQATVDVDLYGFTNGIKLVSDGADVTYNKIFIRYIFNCKKAIVLTGTSNTSGTVAQNAFYGGKIGIAGSVVDGLIANDDFYYPLYSELVDGRTNNNNAFFNVDFEGKPAGTKMLIDGNCNAFIACRFEGVGYVEITRNDLRQYLIGGTGLQSLIGDFPGSAVSVSHIVGNTFHGDVLADNLCVRSGSTRKTLKFNSGGSVTWVEE